MYTELGGFASFMASWKERRMETHRKSFRSPEEMWNKDTPALKAFPPFLDRLNINKLSGLVDKELGTSEIMDWGFPLLPSLLVLHLIFLSVIVYWFWLAFVSHMDKLLWVFCGTLRKQWSLRFHNLWGTLIALQMIWLRILCCVTSPSPLYLATLHTLNMTDCLTEFQISGSKSST